MWRVEGDVPEMPLKRVMTVAKRADGGLVIHNAIALDDAGMAQIEQWGPVRVIVVPNGYHRLDAKVFAARFPEARVICPAGARKKVEEVVPVKRDVCRGARRQPRALRDARRAARQAEGAMIVRDTGGTTLVLNDIVFNMPHRTGSAGSCCGT